MALHSPPNGMQDCISTDNKSRSNSLMNRLNSPFCSGLLKQNTSLNETNISVCQMSFGYSVWLGLRLIINKNFLYAPKSRV